MTPGESYHVKNAIYSTAAAIALMLRGQLDPAQEIIDATVKDNVNNNWQMKDGTQRNGYTDHVLGHKIAKTYSVETREMLTALQTELSGEHEEPAEGNSFMEMLNG